jgi:protein-S-isoprenylcysteine O-methyltransferase Ste14
MLGRPSIAVGPYVLGKVSLLACWAALVARWWWAGLVWFRHPVLLVTGAVLLAVGLVVAGAGIGAMGDSTRMGLPTEQTVFRTGGVYRFSRNPMYLGAHLMCLAAVLWTANPIVLALFVTEVLLHHQITLAEERYLAATFGKAYREYLRRVRRYV